jgi:two-component system, cell cycle sensor histidine kinase DivJ
MDFAPIGKSLDGMVHTSAVGDRLSMLRHRDFIATHLGAGLLVLAAIPIWLALLGPTSIAAALTLCWVIVPLATAVYLSRTGRLERAHLASVIASAALIVWLAAMSGGARSSILVWLVLLPFQASLSGVRRVVMAAVAVSIVAIVVLLTAESFGQVSSDSVAESLRFDAVLVGGAIVCAGGLAARMEKLARESASAVRRSEERYRLLANHSTDLITRHSVNGDVEFASPAAYALTGAAISDVLGEGLFHRVHVADRPTYLRALSEAYVSHRSVTAEFRLMHANTAAADGDGVLVPVEMRCQPVIESDGTVSTVIAVIRDITKRKEHEDELQLARDVADRANRAKTQFLAHMSHELRTPLNAIIGFSEILESGAIGDLAAGRRREYAKLIRVSGEHLLEVVNGILDMSKIESGMFAIVTEPVRVAPLIDGCCDMLGQQAAERGVSIIREIPEVLPEIAADIRACRQILLNLLSNAIKFTDRGGAIAVGASVEGNTMALFVRDTGIGIAAEDLPRLGTPFVQAEPGDRRHHEGTGLGLSMVKGLTALHGGRLVIESKPGVGTTATAFLPIGRALDRSSAGALESLPPSDLQQKERRSA